MIFISFKRQDAATVSSHRCTLRNARSVFNYYLDERLFDTEIPANFIIYVRSIRRGGDKRKFEIRYLLEAKRANINNRFYLVSRGKGSEAKILERQTACLFPPPPPLPSRIKRSCRDIRRNKGKKKDGNASRFAKIEHNFRLVKVDAKKLTEGGGDGKIDGGK